MANNHQAIPVDLPPAPLNNIIKLPLAPQNPPSDDDLVRATYYAEDILMCEGRGTASAADVRNVQVYHSKILQRVGNQEIPPPWFQNAMAQINERLDTLKQDFARVVRTSAMAYNLSVSQGDILALEAVPFRDLTWPTDHGLPPLHSAEAINTLDDATLQAYFRGYHPLPAALPPTPEALRQAVRNAIGCLRKG